MVLQVYVFIPASSCYLIWFDKVSGSMVSSYKTSKVKVSLYVGVY